MCIEQPFSMLVIMQNTHKKVNLQEMKVNATKQERFLWTEITFVLGKNKFHNSSGLGSRLIAVVRQVGSDTKL